mgnify:FL=1
MLILHPKSSLACECRAEGTEEAFIIFLKWEKLTIMWMQSWANRWILCNYSNPNKNFGVVNMSWAWDSVLLLTRLIGHCCWILDGYIALICRTYQLSFIYFLGRFFRLLSVYIVYQYLAFPGRSVVIFTFICLSAASTIFLIVHSPWRGRSLTSYQVLLG